MILGAICTRRCPFCDVAHGRPVAPDANEPQNWRRRLPIWRCVMLLLPPLTVTICAMAVLSILLTVLPPSAKSPNIKIETLVPDFRGRMDRALDILTATPPDVFNHNTENVPRIYRQVRPGADYNWSLKLLERFKEAHPHIPTKSGLMVGWVKPTLRSLK